MFEIGDLLILSDLPSFQSYCYNPICFPQISRYINQIRDLVNRGAPVNGIGAQAHLGPKSIDLGKVEDAFNKLWSNFKFPIW